MLIQRFEFNGISYGSVEGFAQSIRLTSEDSRRSAVEKMNRKEAREFGLALSQELGGKKRDSIYWKGESILYRSDAHETLIEHALRAKFDTSEIARTELLSTVKSRVREKPR